jgi:hypothetical protein
VTELAMQVHRKKPAAAKNVRLTTAPSKIQGPRARPRQPMMNMLMRKRDFLFCRQMIMRLAVTRPLDVRQATTPP